MPRAARWAWRVGFRTFFMPMIGLGLGCAETDLPSGPAEHRLGSWFSLTLGECDDIPGLPEVILPSCRRMSSDTFAILNSDFNNSAYFRSSHAGCDSLKNIVFALRNDDRLLVADQSQMDSIFPDQPATGYYHKTPEGDEYIVFAGGLFTDPNQNQQHRTDVATHEAAHTKDIPDEGALNTYEIGHFCSLKSNEDPWVPPDCPNDWTWDEDEQMCLEEEDPFENDSPGGGGGSGNEEECITIRYTYWEWDWFWEEWDERYSWDEEYCYPAN